MDDLSTFLQLLMRTPGVPGREDAVRKVIMQAWQPYCDLLEVSRLGAVHALKRGAGAGRLRLLLTAHMDRLGLLVSRIEGELLYMRAAGGVDVRVLAGIPVIVHGSTDIPGTVVMPPARLMPPDSGGAIPGLQSLWIDTGLAPAALQDLVQPGNMVSFAQEPLDLGGEILAGPGLDNRVSVASLTACLMELSGREHMWDIWVCASVQEETGQAGSATTSFQIMPDVGIAVDTTFARAPGSNEYNAFPLGGGVSLGWGPENHPALYRAACTAADRLGIPWAAEYMPRDSGTDAGVMQVTGAGIPTFVIGIPVRYMHSPVEMAALADIRRAGQLLAELAASLDEDFLNTLQQEYEA